MTLLFTNCFQDLPAVRNLAVVYTLAGADCIDVAAEEAVIEAARFPHKLPLPELYCATSVVAVGCQHAWAYRRQYRTQYKSISFLLKA